MGSKKNGVVSNRDGQLLTIRYYDVFENVSCIETESPLNINVGDFVKSEYWQGFSYGYHLEKFEPSMEDLLMVKENNKYLEIISEGVSSYYRKLLTMSRNLFLTTKKKDELTTVSSFEKGKSVILTDEEIEEIISLLSKSIKIMGISGGSGKSSFWLGLQLRNFYRHANLSLYTRCIEGAIAPEINGFVNAGTSTFSPLNSNCDTRFSISNQNGEPIFNARLNMDGVESSPCRDDILDREVVFLEKEKIGGQSAYEYLCNSPFCLLVKKVMNRREYDELLSAFGAYNRQKNNIDKYLSIIKIGVDYWADEINSPIFNMNDITFRAMCSEIFAYQNAGDSKFSEEEIEKFKEALTQIVLKDVLLTGRSYLSVDYNPSLSLAKAAKIAGINPSFSWKTNVVVYRDEIDLPDRVISFEQIDEKNVLVRDYKRVEF